MTKLRKLVEEANKLENLAVAVGSKTMATQLLNNPQKANNEQLIIFSNILGITPYKLYQNYQIGRNKLSKVEIEYHKDFENIKG